ncbi:MAG: heat-inducible transcription repressor HrcA [Deltaproteobacteria bacterium]|nr:heat-inducible transcription repressor HrcA [Deltaproteobacteria bacterium]
MSFTNHTKAQSPRQVRAVEDLPGRSRRVLELVIETYIASGEPVGSRTLTRAHGLDVSPATVRNEMMDLEEAGLLSHPYTSAGRVPTARAFRWFIELKMRDSTLSRPIASHSIRSRPTRTRASPAACGMPRAVLSRLSRCPGMALAPMLGAAVFQHVDFVRLRAAEILAIFVSSTGAIVNRIVHLDEDVTQAHLGRLAEFLRERLTGVPLDQVRDGLLDELAHDRALIDDLSRQVLEASRCVFEPESQGEVFVVGTSSLLEHPEFSEPERVRSLFEALEDRELIVNILDRARVAGGVSVAIGSEAGIEGVEDLVVVSSPYRRGDAALGSIGIIGPTRIDYSRVIPMVEYTAQLISRFLDVR